MNTELVNSQAYILVIRSRFETITFRHITIIPNHIQMVVTGVNFLIQSFPFQQALFNTRPYHLNTHPKLPFVALTNNIIIIPALYDSF